MKKLNYSQRKKLEKTLTVIGVILVTALVIGLLAALVNKPADDDREKVDFKIYNGDLDPGSFTPVLKDGYIITSPIPYEAGDTFTIEHEDIAYCEVHYVDENGTYLLDGPTGLTANKDGVIEVKLEYDATDATDSKPCVRFVFYLSRINPEINIFDRWEYEREIKIYKTPGTVTETDDET